MQDPRDKRTCISVTQALWVYALAKAGGDKRPFIWETVGRFVPTVKA